MRPSMQKLEQYVARGKNLDMNRFYFYATSKVPAPKHTKNVKSPCLPLHTRYPNSALIHKERQKVALPLTSLPKNKSPLCKVLYVFPMLLCGFYQNLRGITNGMDTKSCGRGKKNLWHAYS